MEVQEINMVQIIFGIILILIFISCLVLTYIDNRRKEKTKISFKEGLDLAELPIATFMCNNKKLHFILDTGSNISYINEEALQDVVYEDIKEQTKTTGVGGSSIPAKLCKIDISYKDHTYKEVFGILDLSAAFNSIKKECGITLHGIIGNKFFEKYKYILDFKDLIAYRG